MIIDVLSASMAERFVPKVPTIAMRIYGSRGEYEPLIDSPLYIATFKYRFEDLGPEDLDPNELERKGFILFDDEIARRIITAFAVNRHNAQGLMVHCKAGEGRSAGVASGLNDAFSLGANPGDWETPKMNRYVYETIVGVADKMRTEDILD